MNAQQSGRARHFAASSCTKAGRAGGDGQVFVCRCTHHTYNAQASKHLLPHSRLDCRRVDPCRSSPLHRCTSTEPSNMQMSSRTLPGHCSWKRPSMLTPCMLRKPAGVLMSGGTVKGAPATHEARGNKAVGAAHPRVLLFRQCSLGCAAACGQHGWACVQQQRTRHRCKAAVGEQSDGVAVEHRLLQAQLAAARRQRRVAAGVHRARGRRFTVVEDCMHKQGGRRRGQDRGTVRRSGHLSLSQLSRAAAARSPEQHCHGT